MKMRNRTALAMHDGDAERRTVAAGGRAVLPLNRFYEADKKPF
jgi:hypothetical protein